MPRSKSSERQKNLSLADSQHEREIDAIFARSVLSKMNQLRLGNPSRYSSCNTAFKVQDKYLLFHDLVVYVHLEPDSLLYKNKDGHFPEHPHIRVVNLENSSFEGAALMIDYFYTGRAKLDCANALLERNFS